ncbi:MAG: glutathione-disulfide reductase [Alphaproteobacteria bacterium]|nr:glutathione-disulfide reductase [Alphaproteobacteria bacterium]
MPDFDVDLFVIGGGSGGVRAGRIAASYGARVAIAEEYRMGGTCVIRGCVPKKLLVMASRVAADIGDAAGFGWRVGPAEFDWPTLIANKDKEIARLEAAYSANVEAAGARIIRSRAVIEEPHRVRLSASGEIVTAQHILVATGGTPNHGSAIPGIENVISSNEVFHLGVLPRRVVIQGGGYIAMEFASIFAGLGSKVSVIYRGENILRGFDDDVRAHVRAGMENCGVTIRTGCTVTRVDRNGDGFTTELSDGHRIGCDQVMFAIGRRPNTAGLGLAEVGVALNPDHGGIIVDDNWQTSVKGIHALGDVTNRVNLTPVAIREGHAFADMLFGNRKTRVDYSNIPTAVFTQPAVGTVGLTEAEARAVCPEGAIYRTTFRPMKATLSGRTSRVLMKLVVDGVSNRVLGCHIVGDDGPEIIQAVAIALRMGATKADFDATMALHPTAAEELVTMRQPAATWSRAPV